MSDFSKIAKQMKADWDRRIDHDYRFWMSDGYESDEAMWRSGERDFAIIVKNLENLASKSFLEVGCGVGRILKPALSVFQQVMGVDVSAKAIDKAKSLLGSNEKLSLINSNGVDLNPVQNDSIDVVASFAALTSIPTGIIANYLREMHRVLKVGGIVRLQCYIGEAQSVKTNDTLHIRCYPQDNLEKAVAAAGFSVEYIEELVLPIQVSFEDLGLKAVMMSLVKEDRQPLFSPEIASLLLPEGETEIKEDDESGNELEYWMALGYAKELVEKGDTVNARKTLEFAELQHRNLTIDVRDILDSIVKQIEEVEQKEIVSFAIPASYSPMPRVGTHKHSVADLYERNLAILKDCFPEVHNKFNSELAFVQNDTLAEVKDSQDGPVVFYDGQCLDHQTKPVAAARNWIKKVSHYGDEVKSLVIFGMGFGYHVEELLQASNKHLYVIEPNISVFYEAMRCVNLEQLLTSIKGLSIGSDVVPEFFKDDTELEIRPQSQAVAHEYCKQIRAKFYGTRGLKTLHPKFAVLGPLQGGTLPIAGYTAQALREMKQRNRDLNVSGFAGGFDVLSNFVHDDLRLAALRGNYTTMVSDVILESINEKPIDVLICMALAPLSGKVLTELRKRGVITVLWYMEDFLRFRYWEPMAQYFDFVFTIQKGDCIEAIKRAGAGEVYYLPMACDPAIHSPVQLSAEEKQRWGSPVSFVGAGYHNRQQVFASLADMPFKLWGTEWPDCKPFDRLVQENGRRLQPDEYIKIFNASDINLNLHSSMERDGVDPNGDFLNPRTFELAAAGAFQLVDERSLLPEVFEVDKEIITFSSSAEMKEKISYYLAHPEERQPVVEAARKRVLSEHTYQQRIQEMLSIVYSSKFEQLQQRVMTSPWTKMLNRAKPHKELHRRCEIAYERGEEPILDGLVSDIVEGQGALSETEQILLFLFHVRKQIIRMRHEEKGEKPK